MTMRLVTELLIPPTRFVIKVFGMNNSSAAMNSETDVNREPIIKLVDETDPDIGATVLIEPIIDDELVTIPDK